MKGSRRGFLSRAGVMVAVGLAGCMGGPNGDGGDGPNGDEGDESNGDGGDCLERIETPEPGTDNRAPDSDLFDLHAINFTIGNSEGTNVTGTDVEETVTGTDVEETVRVIVDGFDQRNELTLRESVRFGSLNELVLESGAAPLSHSSRGSDSFEFEFPLKDTGLDGDGERGYLWYKPNGERIYSGHVKPAPLTHVEVVSVPGGQVGLESDILPRERESLDPDNDGTIEVGVRGSGVCSLGDIDSQRVRFGSLDELALEKGAVPTDVSNEDNGGDGSDGVVFDFSTEETELTDDESSAYLWWKPESSGVKIGYERIEI